MLFFEIFGKYVLPNLEKFKNFYIKMLVVNESFYFALVVEEIKKILQAVTMN